VDVERLQSFDSSAEIIGLVRRLHGLGMTIQRLQIISDGGKAAEVKEQR
jgi:hypothetical protein